MLREGGVVVVAGFQRLLVSIWATFCIFAAIAFFIGGVLKVIGLIAAFGMQTLDGVELADNAHQDIAVHVIVTLVFFVLGYVFVRLFRKSLQRLRVPYEQELQRAAEVVLDIEQSTKSGVSSVKEAVNSAISNAAKRKQGSDD